MDKYGQIFFRNGQIFVKDAECAETNMITFWVMTVFWMNFVYKINHNSRNRNLIFHSIAHLLSCKYDHFWGALGLYILSWEKSNFPSLENQEVHTPPLRNGHICMKAAEWAEDNYILKLLKKVFQNMCNVLFFERINVLSFWDIVDFVLKIPALS